MLLIYYFVCEYCQNINKRCRIDYNIESERTTSINFPKTNSSISPITHSTSSLVSVVYLHPYPQVLLLNLNSWSTWIYDPLVFNFSFTLALLLSLLFFLLLMYNESIYLLLSIGINLSIGCENTEWKVSKSQFHKNVGIPQKCCLVTSKH